MKNNLSNVDVLEFVGYGIAIIIGVAIIWLIDLILKSNKKEEPTINSELEIKVAPCPIILRVKNNSNEKREVNMFGHNRNIHQPNCGNTSDIEIMHQNCTSYKEILTDMALNPVDISLIRVTTKEEYDIPEKFIINIVDPQTGRACTYPIILREFMEASKDRFQKGILDVPVSLHVCGRTQFSFELNAKTELQLVFFQKEETSSKYINSLN